MISAHITYEEAIFSQTAIRHGIKNHPTSDILERMKLVADKCFEPVRNHFNVPIKISSFYRCEELNRKIGGARNSQHVSGEAIDMQAIPGTGITNKMIHDYIKDNLVFDQLIWEYGTVDNPAWVHVSFKKSGNRQQTLTVR